MPRPFSIPMDKIVDTLGLERKPNTRPGASSFYVRCPFCGDKKYRMNINSDYGTYRCLLCNEDEKGTGALDLYARVRFGVRVRSGSNSKDLYKSLLKELGMDTPDKSAYRQVSQLKESEVINRASDENLNKAYSALISLSPLRLTDSHRENLQSRGFCDEQIAANGYASIPSPKWVNAYPSVSRVYTENSIKKEAKKHRRLDSMGEMNLKAGIAVAGFLVKKGISLSGVPGFFKLGDFWAFMYHPGMIIPTRNSRGEIVGCQIRRDTVLPSQPRYMTISSKGLPEGVTKGISRIHFPLSNSKDDVAHSSVIITEGPLKSDLAVGALKNSYIIALQGVNNTAELPQTLDELSKAGVKKIAIAFDMDRLLNPHVERAGKSIAKLAGKVGISATNMYWGERDAEIVSMKLRQICKANGIDRYAIVPTMTVYETVQHQAKALRDIDVDYSEVKWPSNSKGIDDYLKNNTI